MGGGGRLDAVELDARRLFRRWMEAHGSALGDVLEHGTWLDRDDVDALLELAVPGVDELMALLEIVRLASASRRYDAVVVDTAPTGHAIRLLESPDAVRAIAGVLDTLQRDYRFVRERLARVRRPDAADRLIERLEDQARQAAALLRDRRTTAFHWVALAEDLSVAETADGLRTLERLGVSVVEVIVNRVTPAGPPCPICDLRRAGERAALVRLRRVAGRRPLRLVEAAPREPRGAARLKAIGDRLHAPLRPLPAAPPVRRRAARAAERVSPKPLRAAALARARLVFCAGKGGVGKTTVAAAIALRLARLAPDDRMLLISTDPAHSIGDALAARASDAPAPVAGAPRNLAVRELDAGAALASRRAELEAALRTLAESVGAASAAADAGVAGLIDLAPPGIDELLGVLSVVEARRAFRTVVVDTAPTAHALRLLEMPDAARAWLQALLRVLLKYRRVVRPGQLAESLVTLSRQVRELQEMLRDPARTRFVVVARAAELPRLETGRLLAALKRSGMTAPLLVVNAVTMDPGACPRCRAVRTAERRELAALDALCGKYGCAIILAPLAGTPPRGAAALERWGRTWIA